MDLRMHNELKESPLGRDLSETEAPKVTGAQRGASLIVVVVILAVVLVGGLAAVAITGGQLSKTRGFRTKAIDQACAEAGLRRMRAMLPTIANHDATEGTITSGGTTLTYRAGHYDGDGANPFEVLEAEEFDVNSLFVSENITNVLGTTGGTDISTGIHVIRLTTVCGADGHGEREVETIVRYGLPVGAR